MIEGVRNWLLEVLGAPVPVKQRRPLSPRRESVVQTIKWLGTDGHVHEYRLGVGFHESGETGEIFFSELHEGSMMQMLLDDYSVFISRLHQHHGISFEDMVTLMSAHIDPISPLGLALREAVAQDRRPQKDRVA